MKVDALVMAHGKEYYRSVLPFDVNLADAEKTDIIFTYFNSVSDTGRVLTEETADGIIDKSLPTVLLIHGWTSDDTSPWFNSLKEGYFNLGSYNVIYINWYKAGSKEYYVSCDNIVPVGKFIAEFLITSSLSLGSVQIVGFSLGAQLASIIGKRVFDSTDEKIGRITALDPAGPGFEKLETMTSNSVITMLNLSMSYIQTFNIMDILLL
ncbi:hypothetical protein NQ317_019651 [Molorchus minor]|uniref:Lipase domain-containing protein n=1 Tax=Molorchus minor TaxID=1323400 RepID=A0ABQ9IWE1_9CUCU|nr:hypothetical protein NQ317_019651 [Molorchus minor]